MVNFKFHHSFFTRCCIFQSINKFAKANLNKKDAERNKTKQTE